jgi:dihydrofolate reductase
MRPLRYSINVTLDGCCDHRAIPADEDLHRHAVENLEQADALLFGRVTYELMRSAWQPPAATEARPDWMEPFAQTINAATKYVVSSTLEQLDWNAELVRGDLGEAVLQLKRESGKGLFVGGVKLPLALTELGLIDEYEFVVHPRLAGHGPTVAVGLASPSGRRWRRLVAALAHTPAQGVPRQLVDALVNVRICRNARASLKPSRRGTSTGLRHSLVRQELDDGTVPC